MKVLRERVPATKEEGFQISSFDQKQTCKLTYTESVKFGTFQNSHD